METYNVLNLIFNEKELEVDSKVSIDKVVQILEAGIIKTSVFNEDDSTHLKEYKITSRFYNLDNDSMNLVIESTENKL